MKHDRAECFSPLALPGANNLRPLVILDKPEGSHFNSLSISLTTVCGFFFFFISQVVLEKQALQRQAVTKPPFFEDASRA